MKQGNQLLKIFIAVVIFWSAATGVQAGDIVPMLDDATAIFDVTAAQKGTSGEITPIEGGGEITLAARFTAASADLTAAGPVIIIECGGTSFGQGLYISGGNLIFATKGTDGSSGDYATQTSLNDTDASDSAAAVTIGSITAGVETEVYASLNSATGELMAAINGVISSFTFTGTIAAANLTGNESVSFLGSGDITVGELGGLTNRDMGQDPLWDANAAVNFTGMGGSIRGQIFADLAPGQMPPYSIVITESGSSTSVQEGGSMDEITVSLTDDPGSYPVTVLFSDASDPDQVQINPAQLIFNSSNWGGSQSAAVSAVDDSFHEPRIHTASIQISVQTDPASNYYGYSPEDVIVYIAENDCEVWQYHASDVNHDCQIDLSDLSEHILSWLSCSLPEAGCIDYRP